MYCLKLLYVLIERFNFDFKPYKPLVDSFISLGWTPID